MAISTQTQNLNLIPGKSAPVVVHCSQGNVGDTVQFYLYDGDDPFYPTNVSIAVHGVRADGSVFGPYTVSVTSGSNLVSFELVTAMTSVNGAAIGELVITDSGENQVGSANFGILVEATPYSSTVTYEDDLSIYQRILAYVQSIPAELSGQIAAEASARNRDVSNLQSQISAEASARETAVANEASARIAGDNALNTEITNLKSAVGSPLVASSSSGMTDKTKIYVFTGTQTGYTTGNWYYWNGSAWTSGGVYNSVAISTDKALSVSGQAADAKATGDHFEAIKPIINNLMTRDPLDINGYAYPTIAGKTYKFSVIGSSGGMAVWASADGTTSTVEIAGNIPAGSSIIYKATSSQPYLKIRSNTNGLRMYVEGWEIHDTISNDVKNLTKPIFEKGVTSGKLASVTSKSINLTNLSNYGFLANLKMIGATYQAKGTPTPQNRLPITSDVSKNASGKYVYNLSIVTKSGENITKQITLNEPLYADDYIDVLGAKIYRYDYAKHLDGTSTYTRQTFGNNARFMTTSVAAAATATGYCDGLKVDSSPTSDLSKDLTISNYANAQSVFMVYNAYTTGDALKTYLTSNPMLYVYKRSAPEISDVPELAGFDKYMSDIVSVSCECKIKAEYSSKITDGGVVYVGRRVGYSAAGDYTSILQALKETSDNTTVIVGRGTYDIVQEYKDYYGDDFWDNYSGYGEWGVDRCLRGLWIGFGRKIIFDPFSEVVFNYTGSNDLVRSQFSPFATGGDGCIDGLRLTFNNGCRYAVHDDFAECDGEFVYKNCIFNGQAQSDTIGGGCGQSNRYIIENCIFSGNTAQDHDDISFHNSGWSTGRNQIVVKDCYCENGIHFKWYGTSTSVTDCIVTNCTARRVICTAHNVTPNDTENMRLTAWNNIVSE